MIFYTSVSSYKGRSKNIQECWLRLELVNDQMLLDVADLNKGQLMSKRYFGVTKSTKKPTKFS